MGAVSGETPPPPELRIAWQCERWHCLPEAGAYLDQDHRTMTHMSVLMTVYNAYARYRNAHGTQIHSLTENERRVLRMLKDMGILFKA